MLLQCKNEEEENKEIYIYVCHISFVLFLYINFAFDCNSTGLAPINTRSNGTLGMIVKTCSEVGE